MFLRILYIEISTFTLVSGLSGYRYIGWKTFLHRILNNFSIIPQLQKLLRSTKLFKFLIPGLWSIFFLLRSVSGLPLHILEWSIIFLSSLSYESSVLIVLLSEINPRLYVPIVPIVLMFQLFYICFVLVFMDIFNNFLTRILPYFLPVPCYSFILFHGCKILSYIF